MNKSGVQRYHWYQLVWNGFHSGRIHVWSVFRLIPRRSTPMTWPRAGDSIPLLQKGLFFSLGGLFWVFNNRKHARGKKASFNNV